MLLLNQFLENIYKTITKFWKSLLVYYFFFKLLNWFLKNCILEEKFL